MLEKLRKLKLDIVVAFCIVTLIHRRSFTSDTTVTRYHMGWYSIGLGITFLVPGISLVPSLYFLNVVGSVVPIYLFGLFFILLGLNDFLALSKQMPNGKIPSNKINVGYGILMSLFALGSAILGFWGFGVFVFSYYTYHQIRILRSSYPRKIKKKRS